MQFVLMMFVLVCKDIICLVHLRSLQNEASYLVSFKVILINF
jgi:hypothetical protein